MSSWRIRWARAEDASVLAELRYRFREEMGLAAEDHGAFVERAAAWMAERLAGGRPWRALLAEADGRVIGCGWVQLIEKVPNPGPEEELHGYITSLFVEPRWRGAGLGAALLEGLVAACREAGVDAILLWPSERSRGLYERMGFAAPGDVLGLQVGSGRTPGGFTRRAE